MQTSTLCALLLIDIYTPARIVTNSSSFSRHGLSILDCLLYIVADVVIGHVDLGTYSVASDCMSIGGHSDFSNGQPARRSIDRRQRVVEVGSRV